MMVPQKQIEQAANVPGSSSEPTWIGPEKQIEETSDASESSSESDSVLLKIPPPPDGGILAWLHVFFGHMVFFNTIGMTNSYGVFE